jgi:predicted type IV restriction endonuclease
VFVEVTLPGREDGGDRQLFEYAFHQGVPLAILTTGREWHFFLPSGQGEYQERRVYKLDLVEREASDSAERFRRYLEFNRVRDGSAREAFEEDHKNNRRLLDVARTIPEAWSRLVEGEDELLIELVSDKVEDLCGYKPKPDEVAKYLKGYLRAPMQPSTPPPIPAPSNDPTKTNPYTSPAGNTENRPGFYRDGRFIAASSAIGVMIEVFRCLGEADPGFFERFASHPHHGRTRRYLDRDPDRLYSNRPDLVAGCSFEIEPGWWLGTNYSRAQILRIIDLACTVAGKPIADLHLSLGN